MRLGRLLVRRGREPNMHQSSWVPVVSSRLARRKPD